VIAGVKVFIAFFYLLYLTAWTNKEAYCNTITAVPIKQLCSK